VVVREEKPVFPYQLEGVLQEYVEGLSQIVLLVTKHRKYYLI
jgi:hypothetical protein